MPATITGRVFNDLNHNGILDPGEPGIPSAYVVIRNPNGVCTTVQTDVTGTYTFTPLNIAGNYTIYETAINPGATCPPTLFGQPVGFTNSTTFRTQVINVTATQITNNVTINGDNYGHDNPDTFSCIAFGYQVGSTGGNSEFLRINLVTGTVTTIDPDIGININAIGYNILDNMIYGIEVGTRNLIRLAEDGTVTNFGPIPNLPAPPPSYLIGDVDDFGHLYIYQINETRYYVVDVDQNSPTFGQLLDPTAGFVVDTSPYGTPITALSIADWHWNQFDQQLYGISAVTGRVIRIDPLTGTTTPLTTTGIPSGDFYGAVFGDGDGFLYAINNNTGVVYRITISGDNATGEVFSQSIAVPGNDGAACRNALLEVDYGDAPDTTPGNGADDYSTLLANNGPRHQIINELTLGTQVTAENDAYQNPDATGDDLIQGIQDDGLSVPLTPLLVTDTTYSLQVDVVNNTGLPANLYGWVDFNKDGIFQGNEAAPVQVIPSAVGVQQATLNFTVPVGVTLTLDHTFVRLRLTTDTLINNNSTVPTLLDTRSIGPASDGEVEDYYLEIAPVADISVIKTAAPQPVIAGELLTYTLNIANAGPNDAQDVSLADAVPAGLTNVEFSTDGGTTWLPWSTPYSIGTLVVGGSVQILIRGTVDPSLAGTSIVNIATVSSTTFDPDLNNNTSTVTSQVIGSADVSIVKTTLTTPVVPGEQIQYSLEVANSGPSDAVNVIVNDAVPATIGNPEYSLDGGTTWQLWTGSINLGTLPAGATPVTILIRGTVSASVTGDLSNTATVTSDTPDPDPTNNTSTTIDPLEPSADVSIIKTTLTTQVVAGEQVEYSLEVANAGPSDAQNVVVSDPIPANIESPEYSLDGGVTWLVWGGSLPLGILPAGGTPITILIRGTVSVSATGNIVNTGTVTSDTPDPDPTNNTSTVTDPVGTSADVSIVKTNISGPVVAGEEVRYSLEVANAGPSDALNVVVNDMVSPDIENPEYSLDGGTTWLLFTGSVALGTLPAGGAPTTILIRGTLSASATGSLVNTGTVTSDTPDPNPTNNTSTVTDPVGTSADVSIVKTNISGVVVAGEEVRYSLEVANAGASDAVNVIVNDAVPATIQNPEYSLDGGITWQVWTGSVNLGTLVANGTPIIILIRGTINPGATGTLTNTATVTSNTPDPDPTNNTSTITENITTSADVAITKSVSPNPMLAGEEATYILEVTNSGPSDAVNVVITDNVPLQNPEYSLDNGITWLAWSGSVNLDTVIAGATRTILIRGTVSSSATGTLTNTATVTSDTPDPDPSNNTTTIVTPVNALADMRITKNVSPDPMLAGQQAIYTLEVTNLGPADAVNVVVTDNVPLQNPEYSLNNGTTWAAWIGSLNLGTVVAGATRTILIRGIVDPAATGNLINTATVTSDTEDPDPTNNTTTITTPIEALADLSILKSVSPNPVVAGEQATYTLTITNAGPSTAENVVINDNVPLNNPEYSLDGGTTWMAWTGSIGLGNLAVGATRTILIRGLVSASTTGNLINTATVDSDTTDPDPTDNTTTITTPVNTLADIAVVKTASPNPVKAGSMITYTMVVSNNGPSDAQDVTLTDAIPAIIQNPEYSLDGGSTWMAWTGSIGVGTILVGATRTVLIRGTVSETAMGNLTNTAVVSSPTPDPTPGNNTSTTRTLVARIDVAKTSSVVGAVVGDTINYSVTVTNSGEVTAENVVVTDPLSPEVTYSGNLKLNGNPINGMITAGVDIGNLAPGASATLTFDVKVVAVPTDKTITNQGVVNYIYRQNASAPPIQGTDTSNPVDVRVYSPDINVTKSSDTLSVEVGTPFVYTMNVTNTGDIALNNVIVKDNLPASFIVQSITVDGAVANGDIRTGLNIGTLQIGQTKVVKVTIIINDTVDIDTFNNLVEVTGSAPVDPNQPPKEVTDTGEDETGIDIYNPKLVLEKRADKSFAVVDDIVTYTIKATNQGNLDLSNIQFDTVNLFDVLPSELEFIAGSVTLDGVSLPQANILAGVNIGSLLVNQTKTLTFKAKVVSGQVTPIVNTATGEYSYQLPGGPVQNETTESNEVEINVGIANIDIIKTADKDEVNLGDTITYTVKVMNTGNLTAYNVLFTDTLPAQVELVPGSFKIGTQVVNGIDLAKGITIPSIAPSQTVTLTYQVKVTSSNCSGLLINQAQVVFDYRFPDGSGGTITETSETNTATVELTLTTFKQMSIESYLMIPEAKPDIEAINVVTGAIDISSCHVINTPQAISTEGQNLTGYKLIIKGSLNIVVEYTALEETQSVHSAHYSVPFSAFIVLPPNYVIGSKLEVSGLVEDIYYKAVDIRTFFTNVTALINVKILSC